MQSLCCWPGVPVVAGVVVAMGERIVSALVPQSTGARSRVPAEIRRMRSRLPLAEVMPVPGDASWVYGIGRVDASGRIAENTVVRALGWAAGDHVSVSVRGGAAVVRRDPQGVFTIPAVARVLLPGPVRTRVGVSAGDRLLLAADPAQDVVVTFPMRALDAVLAPHTSSLVGGELS